METNRINPNFPATFQAASIQELVEFFNQSVNNHGWTSMRAVHDQMLIHEFMRRGIDISAIHDGNTTDFSHAANFDKEHNKLVIAKGK